MRKQAWVGIVLASAGMLLFGTAQAQVKWSSGTFDQALVEASKNKGFVMVDFFTTWCVPCKMLDAGAWQDPSLSKFLADHHVVALRQDAEKEGAKLAKRYVLHGYPTVILLNAAGAELTRFVGTRDAQFIQKQFEGTFADPRTLETLRKAVKADPTDLQATYLLAEKLLASTKNYPDHPEGEALLAAIAASDPDNAKGLGAKALTERLTMRLTAVFPFYDRIVRDSLAVPWTPDYVYPDIHEGKPDPDLARLHAEADKALAAYFQRLEDDAGTELLKAAEAFSKMKNITVDCSELEHMVPSLAGATLVTPRPKLAAGCYLVLAYLAKDPDTLNNVAWYFYTVQNHLDLAERLARQAMAQKPDALAIKDTLAHILFTTGHGPDAFILERKIHAEAKAAGDEAQAKSFGEALASWESGVADQTVPTEKP